MGFFSKLLTDLTMNCSADQSTLSSVNENMAEVDDHNRSSKPSTERLKRKRIKLSQWPHQSPVLNPIECCGLSLRELCMNRCLQTTVNFSSVVEKRGLKCFHNNVRD